MITGIFHEPVGRAVRKHPASLAHEERVRVAFGKADDLLIDRAERRDALASIVFGRACWCYGCPRDCKAPALFKELEREREARRGR